MFLKKKFNAFTDLCYKDADSDKDKSDEKEDVDPEDVDLQEERKRSLAILEKIVGTRAMSKTKPQNDRTNMFK